MICISFARNGVLCIYCLITVKDITIVDQVVNTSRMSQANKLKKNVIMQLQNWFIVTILPVG